MVFDMLPSQKFCDSLWNSKCEDLDSTEQALYKQCIDGTLQLMPYAKKRGGGMITEDVGLRDFVTRFTVGYAGNRTRTPSRRRREHQSYLEYAKSSTSAPAAVQPANEAVGSIVQH